VPGGVLSKAGDEPVNLMNGLSGRILLLSGAGLGLALFLDAPARADTTSCSAFSTTGITFSPYDSVSKAAVVGTGTITFTCTGTGTTTMNFALSGGYNGQCSPRVMFEQGNLASGNYLSYDVFKDSSRTSAWCTGGSRYDFPLDYSTGPVQTRTITLYGRVSAGQTPAYASYSDTLSMDLKQGGQVFRTIAVPINGSVAPTCALSAGTLAFGAYSPASRQDASASVSVNCTNTAPYQVSLGGGQNLDGGVRRLAGPGGSFLSYGLYNDSARSAAWGDGTSLGAKRTGTGTGNAQSLTVYGRIPAGQYSAPGAYSDSVVVTVEY
jgi:spore coat protein U-like protein